MDKIIMEVKKKGGYKMGNKPKILITKIILFKTKKNQQRNKSYKRGHN